MRLQYFFIILILLIKIDVLYSQHSSLREVFKQDSTLQNDLQIYLNKIPLGKEMEFGFNSKEELKKIELGNPMQIFREKDDSSNVFFHTLNRWKVPLMINNAYRCFAEVIFKNGKYTVIGIGSNELASHIDKFEQDMMLKTIQNKSLFMDYSLNVYCIVIHNSNNKLEFVPFRPMNSEYETASKIKYSSEELHKMLNFKRNNNSYE